MHYYTTSIIIAILLIIYVNFYHSPLSLYLAVRNERNVSFIGRPSSLANSCENLVTSGDFLDLSDVTCASGRKVIGMSERGKFMMAGVFWPQM